MRDISRGAAGSCVWGRLSNLKSLRLHNLGASRIAGGVKTQFAFTVGYQILFYFWFVGFFFGFCPQIDDQFVNLPYQQRDRKISIYRGGQEAVVETGFGLTVTYDWQSQVTVSVPSTYANTLCGLCGNYNGNAGDEMMMKNGQVTSNPDAFGRSWKVTDIPGCLELSKVECPTIAAALQRQEVSKMGCGIISQVDGPFRACHPRVDAIKYFQNCVHDFCLFPDQEDAICQIIASYASACQAAGVTIGKWRTDDFCSKLGLIGGVFWGGFFFFLAS